MVLAVDQVRLVRSSGSLLMGPGTPYTILPEWDPWSRTSRTPQSMDRPYAHGSIVGAEWMDAATVLIPVSVYRNQSTKAEWMAAHQQLAAAFTAVGASGEMCELWFEWGGAEYVMFGRPVPARVTTDNVAVGKSVEQCAFIAPDPRIYSAVESSLSLGLPVQTGGLTVPARPATTRLRLPGASGSYASTPDSTALHITGDLGVRALAHRTSWSGPASEETLAARYDDSTDDRSWRFSLNANGTLRFQWSTDGLSAQSASSSVAVPADATTLAVGAYIDVATGDVVFETSDGIDGTWVPLGATQTGSPTSIYAGTSDLVVGARNGGATAPWDGVVYQVEVRDGGPSGSVVADPDFTDQTPGATSFTDSSGNLWTIHGDAALVADTFTGGLTAPMLVTGRLVGGRGQLTNVGTAAAPLTARIDGPVVEPGFVLYSPDGSIQSVRFSLELLAGQWLEIDSVTHTAFLNGLETANRRPDATWLLDDYPIQPGLTTVRFVSGEYTEAANLTVTARSAWW